MKTTKWIKGKLISVQQELEYINNSIIERGLKEEELITTKYILKSGKELPITIDQRINNLVAQKTLLTEILQ
jgi:hypothetical protein